MRAWFKVTLHPDGTDILLDADEVDFVMVDSKVDSTTGAQATIIRTRNNGFPVAEPPEQVLMLMRAAARAVLDLEVYARRQSSSGTAPL